jgi:hypothetical protein
MGTRAAGWDNRDRPSPESWTPKPKGRFPSDSERRDRFDPDFGTIVVR